MQELETNNTNHYVMSSYCSECSGEEYYLSERMLSEIVQRGIIKVSDLGRTDDPNMPAARKELLRMVLGCKL